MNFILKKKKKKKKEVKTLVKEKTLNDLKDDVDGMIEDGLGYRSLKVWDTTFREYKSANVKLRKPDELDVALSDGSLSFEKDILIEY